MVSKVGSEDYRVTMVWVDVEVLGRWYSKRRVCENLNDTATSNDQPSRHTISVLMNPTQEDSRELLEQAIDAEIKASEETIQAEIKSLELLKLRRNALQPYLISPS